MNPRLPMVLKASEYSKVDSPGFPFNLTSQSNAAMGNKLCLPAGVIIPEHTHQSVQSGYVFSGIYLLRSDELDEILVKGDSYSIPANLEHSMEVLEAGEILEILDSPALDIF